MAKINLSAALNLTLFNIKDDLTPADYKQLRHLFHLGAFTAATAIQMGASVDDVFNEIEKYRSK